MAKDEAKLVDAYIAKQPPSAQPTLRRVRRVIRNAVPGLEEGISYQIPVFKLDGELVVFLGGWKKHYALYPVLEAAKRFAKELSSYEVSKGTIRFPLGDVPEQLITRIVKFRAKLARERATQRVKTENPRRRWRRRACAAR